MQALAAPTLALRLGRPFCPVPPSQRFTRQQCATLRRRQLSAAAASSGTSSPPATASAKESVERGLEIFAAGDAEAALALFQRAQGQAPTPDEARAACYNAACAHTRLRQWQAAVDQLTRAINEYDLKLSVALKDPDLEPLRERREWLAGLAIMRGGINDKQYMQLRSEAKAPFRLTRIIFLGGLAVGAGLGLLIITGRLVAALQGGEGAPELQETLQNFGINSAALAVLGFFVYRDVASSRRDQAVIAQEEALGQLQLSLGGGSRVIPLAAFRGTTRPVIIAGSRSQLSRALAGSEPFQAALRERGVSVVPLELSAEDAGEKLRQLKAEFAGSSGGSSSSKGFGGGAAAPAAAQPAPTAGLTTKDRKWQLKAHDEAEWQQWVQALKAAKGITADAVYVQVQLDGTVRASGAGMPPWRQLVDDLPELDSVRTKFTDGVGL
ncbi:LOW PSII ACCUMULATION chloroplastic [Micractinium conductrix]|uniref:LOW PSII ACCUMULATION chloroplastic n=1 Tax=Micractinium conductrix TaxID=554055 RepID=A0A2P6V832_9CHLO|nr:LOW PSII ACCUMULATION chloroplastic [Micractinium conductrix]|eukprot:PSC70246.1 LOW PSII ACCUMULATION chloroplastic [Micractinium conductrix]